jgi:hypothetical protein
MQIVSNIAAFSEPATGETVTEYLNAWFIKQFDTNFDILYWDGEAILCREQSNAKATRGLAVLILILQPVDPCLWLYADKRTFDVKRRWQDVMYIMQRINWSTLTIRIENRD